MDTNDIITAIMKREGGAVNDPADKGGQTQFGISKAANPQAWADGQVTEQEARDIYTKKYVVGPGFDKVNDEALRAQLVDFGVNSGPAIAIMKLQGILGVKQDGVLGPNTLSAINTRTGSFSNLLAKERVKMFAQIVAKNPSQIKFLVGWINRALEFIV